MSNADLKAGDRVRLSPATEWPLCVNNPLEVLGTISSHRDIHFCYVEWDNGGSNGYRLRDNDLILVSDNTQNSLNNMRW